jgi:hypothetical protein
MRGPANLEARKPAKLVRANMGVASSDTPPDLASLRLAVGSLAADYDRALEEKAQSLSKKQRKEYRKRLDSLRRTCAGSPNSSSKDQLRELMAAGAMSYGLNGRQLPAEPALRP